MGWRGEEAAPAGKTVELSARAEAKRQRAEVWRASEPARARRAAIAHAKGRRVGRRTLCSAAFNDALARLHGERRERARREVLRLVGDGGQGVLSRQHGSGLSASNSAGRLRSIADDKSMSEG